MAKPAGAISYSREGSGEPLVLIHGLGASRLIWKPQVAALARERDVIAIDMPGFGRSAPLPAGREPSAAALGEAVSELLDGLGIERPHVAGNSLGGWVALEMAKANRAGSACLISPAGLWRKPLGSRPLDTQRVAQLLKPALMAAARSDSLRERLLGSTFGRPDRLPREDALEVLRDWIEAPGYAAANEQMRRHVFTDPDQVRVPVTIAWGELDRLVAPPKPERRPPGTNFIVLEDCGHTPNWDNPELLTRVLLEASGEGARAHEPIDTSPRSA